jgi:hypothetical protein
MAKDRTHPGYGKVSTKRQPTPQKDVGDEALFAITDGPSALETCPEHAKLLGLIVSEFSTVEHMLAVVVAPVVAPLESEAVHLLIASAPTSSARLQLMRALFRKRDRSSDERKAMGDLINSVEKLMVRRNLYAHAHFGLTRTGELVMLNLKHMWTGEIVGRLVSIEELRDLYADLRETALMVSGVYTVLMRDAGLHAPQTVQLPGSPAPEIRPRRNLPRIRLVRTGPTHEVLPESSESSQ